MVTDAKPFEKSCSRCGETKNEDKFIKKRNICKECRNSRTKELYNALEIKDSDRECYDCKSTKPSSSFYRNRNL